MKNRVNVIIYGANYVLISEKSEDVIHQIVEIVNQEINDVSHSLVGASKNDILILACNNIAEKYFEEKNLPIDYASIEKIDDTTFIKNIDDTTSTKKMEDELETLKEKILLLEKKNTEQEKEINNLEKLIINLWKKCKKLKQ